MDIVITGGGKVGEELCRDLSSENHNVVLIDTDPDRLEQLSSTYDIKGVLGNGAVYSLQLEADTNKCDLFIAVTPKDEINIIAALTAKRIGAQTCIARVRNPEYSAQIHFIRDELGIDLILNPELEAAREIHSIIQSPSALTVDRILHTAISLVSVTVNPQSELAGTYVRDFRWAEKNGLMVAIERDNQVLIPKGDTRIEGNDLLFCIGTANDLKFLYMEAGAYQPEIRSVLIVGGGRITRYLLPMLLKNNLRIKVIDVNHTICDELAVDFPKVEVIFGDGTNLDFLKEERIGDYDAMISLTNIDEENMIISIFGSHSGVRKTIMKVNRLNLVKLLKDPGLQSVITPHAIVSDQIIRYSRSLTAGGRSEMLYLTRFSDDRIEAIDFKVQKSSPLTNVPLQELNLIENVLIGLIIRGKQHIIPTGKDEILPDDHVVIVTTHLHITEIEEILED
jgi:trk system potassium uptake protein TrkA